MKYILIVVILLLTISVASTQDFRPGYIIKTSGDTVQGFVLYQEGSKIFRQCEFKNSQSSTSNSFTADQISAYAFKNGHRYEARNFSRRGEALPVTAFMEVLARGSISLYYYQNSFYVEKENSGLKELVNTIEEYEVDGVKYFKESNEHFGVINPMIVDCQSMRNKYSKISLNSKSLTKLVEEYNKCVGGSTIAYESDKRLLTVGVDAFVGVNSSQVTFEEKQVHGVQAGGTSERENAILFGLGLGFTCPRASERFSFHTDIFYTQSNYSKVWVQTNPATWYDYSIDISITQIKIPLTLRYTLTGRTIAPYVGAGVCPTIHAKKTSTASLGIHYEGFDGQYSREPLQIAKSQFGLVGGIGFTAKLSSKLNGFMELRIEKTNGITTSNQMTANPVLSNAVTNFQLMVGVSL